MVHATHEAVRKWALRRMGEQVIDSSVNTSKAGCLDLNLEDIKPEDERILEEHERIPERYMNYPNSDDDSSGNESEASIDDCLVKRSREAAKKKLDSSSDASAEQSDDGKEKVTSKTSKR